MIWYLVSGRSGLGSRVWTHTRKTLDPGTSSWAGTTWRVHTPSEELTPAVDAICGGVNGVTRALEFLYVVIGQEQGRLRCCFQSVWLGSRS